MKKEKLPKRLEALVGSDVADIQAFKTNAGKATHDNDGLWLQFTCAFADYAKANGMSYIIFSFPKDDLSFPYWDSTNCGRDDLQDLANYILVNSKERK